MTAASDPIGTVRMDPARGPFVRIFSQNDDGHYWHGVIDRRVLTNKEIKDFPVIGFVAGSPADPDAFAVRVEAIRQSGYWGRGDPEATARVFADMDAKMIEGSPSGGR
jgi:hypothetical protein